MLIYLAELRPNYRKISFKTRIEIFLDKLSTLKEHSVLGWQRNKVDEDRFQIYTAIIRIFNITKMAAEWTQRAVHNGQYWVFKIRARA